MSHLSYLFKRRTIGFFLFLLGVGYFLYSFVALVQCAVFVYEAQTREATVLDVRRMPFDGVRSALIFGQDALSGKPSFRPFVLYVDCENKTRSFELQDADVREYQRGEQIELLVHPDAQIAPRENRFAFIWAPTLYALGASSLIFCFGLLLFKKRTRVRVTEGQVQEKPRRKAAPRKKKQAAPQSLEPAEKKKRAPRSKSAGSTRKKKTSSSTKG